MLEFPFGFRPSNNWSTLTPQERISLMYMSYNLLHFFACGCRKNKNLLYVNWQLQTIMVLFFHGNKSTIFCTFSGTQNKRNNSKTSVFTLHYFFVTFSICKSDFCLFYTKIYCLNINIFSKERERDHHMILYVSWAFLNGVRGRWKLKWQPLEEWGTTIISIAVFTLPSLHILFF